MRATKRVTIDADIHALIAGWAKEYGYTPTRLLDMILQEAVTSIQSGDEIDELVAKYRINAERR